MTTTSSINVWRQVRSHILGFTPPAGQSLQDRMGGRLYYVQADDPDAYPHAIGRWIDRMTSIDSMRDAGALEITWVHRPRKFAEQLEDIVDVCDMAMLQYADPTGGLVFSRERLRSSLEARPAPADRNVVQIWTKYQLVVWPQYLTQFSPFVTP